MTRIAHHHAVRRRVAAGLLAALSMTLGPLAGLDGGVAHASGLADEADLHFQLAAEHYQKAEYREALEHFLLSNRLVPNRKVVFNIARTYEQLKRFADAHRYYVDALEGETSPQTLASLRGAIQRIAPFVAVLRVETQPPGATVYIDRKDLGSRGETPRALAIPAGTYRVIVELEGYEPATLPAVEAHLGSETHVPVALKRIVGVVHVDVEGASAASVHVDDEHAPAACSAPCDLEVPPGRHLLYFSRQGFQGAPRQVNVVARETVKTTATLSPLTGGVVVSADERDALVEIDGRPMGFTPAVIQNVPVGVRHVRVSLRGYTALERDVDVKTDRQSELVDLRLVPLRQVAAVSRYTENIDDAPSSVSIIDRQELRAFGYPTIAEALRGVRGVYISNDRAYYSAGIRGLGEPNDYGNRVLILSDGQTLNDNLLNSSYIGSDGRVDLYDIDRIEVVRGPGSLLYGTGAFSGVVNLVPPAKDEPNSVHLGAGTYDNGVARARFGFHYNFSPKAGIWASASAGRDDGVSIPVKLTSPGAGQPAVQTADHVDYFRNAGTAGRAWYGPFTAQWFFNTREQHIPIGLVGTTFNDLATEFVDTRWMAEVRFEPKISDKLELMTRVHANRYTFHGEYAYGPPTGTQVEDYYGTWFGGEARLVFTPIKALRITGGGEVQVDPQASMLGSSPGAATPYVNVNAPYNFGAGYALVEGSPADWFRVSAGARVDVYSSFGPIVVPRLALIFKPAKGNVLKIMGGRAFRAPSIYEEYYTDGVTQTPGIDPAKKHTLGPESVYSGEVELSQRFLEDWVGLVAGHVSYIEGIINTGPDDKAPKFVRYQNSLVPALATGADLELRREWRQGWMVSASYEYELARYINTTAPNTRLVNSPEHLASFRGVVPVVPDLASLALRMTLEAPRRISADSNDFTSANVIADVAVSGNLKRFGVGYVFGVYNVTDTRYEYPITSTYLSRTIQQNGRTFLADVTVTYP